MPLVCFGLVKQLGSIVMLQHGIELDPFFLCISYCYGSDMVLVWRLGSLVNNYVLSKTENVLSHYHSPLFLLIFVNVLHTFKQNGITKKHCHLNYNNMGRILWQGGVTLVVIKAIPLRTRCLQSLVAKLPNHFSFYTTHISGYLIKTFKQISIFHTPNVP